VLADIVDSDNAGNPFNFPPNVEGTVRVTQVIAICIASKTNMCDNDRFSLPRSWKKRNRPSMIQLHSLCQLTPLYYSIPVLTQDDICNAMNLLRDWFKPNFFLPFQGASKPKWALSIVLRALEGTLGTFVSFMLIMQSENVVDLLLNFTGMSRQSFRLLISCIFQSLISCTFVLSPQPWSL